MRPRVPPHSVEAEQYVLGALLLDNGRMADVDGVMRPGDLYVAEHRAIYETITRELRAARPADVLTVSEAGGHDIGYVNGLAASVPSGRNAAAYARIVSDRARRRRMIELADVLREQAFEAEAGAEAVDAACQAAVTELLRIQASEQRWEPRLIGELLPGWMDALQERADGRVRPIPTGLAGIDRALCGGMERGELVVIGARPSMGKSALSLTIGQRTTAAGHVVLVCSQEDSSTMLVSRNVASAGRVNLARLRQPQLATGQDWERVSDAADVLASRQIWIDDQPGLTLADVRRKASQVKARSPGGRLDVVVVDYLQLMEGDGDNRHLVLGAIAAGLKKLAKELHCAVVLLSQLSRKADETKGPPRMDHLRESGGIEEAADVIGLLFRPARVDPKRDESDAQIELVKNKNGRTCTVRLYFDGALQRFEDVAHEGDEP